MRMGSSGRHSALIVRLVLAVAVAAAMALSCWWVVRVPIFQAPDEGVHFDYVVSLVTAGRLLRASERPVAEMVPSGFFHPFNPYSHPYTLHLEVSTDAKALRRYQEVKLPAGYGSRAFFNEIDRSVPHLSGQPMFNPFLLTEYPVGYYGLVALWASAWQRVFPGLVAMLFASRAFSVLLLGIGLLATFGVFRRLGSTPVRALLLTTAVGLCPLTSFVSSYVQPDNLAFAGVATCVWLALAVRHRVPNRLDLLWLGLALAVLQVTKLHVFLAVALPTAAVLAFAEARRDARRWLEWGLLVVGPSLLAAELQLWVSAGGAGPTLRTLGHSPFRSQLMQTAGSVPVYAVRVVRSMLGNFLGADGTTFRTFWGHFAWDDMPLVTWSPAVQEVLMFLLQGGAIVMLALLAVRLQQVLTVVTREWLRGRRQRALGLLLGNPLINAHLLFGAILVAIYCLTNNGFYAQGRNWFPFLPAILWAVVEFAPRALASRRAARWLSRAVLAALLVYALVGSFWARRAVEERFYGSQAAASVDTPDQLTKAEKIMPRSGPLESASMTGKSRLHAVVDGPGAWCVAGKYGR